MSLQISPFARRVLTYVLAAWSVALLTAGPLHAQEPPPRIPFFVVDLHGVVLPFPNTPALAASRGLNDAQLPGTGFGGDLALHIYPFKWHGVTFGIGGRAVRARAHSDAVTLVGETTPRGAVTEQFTYVGPQVSLNFGTGTGWSYLSGGVSRSKWTVLRDITFLGDPVNLPADEERLKTIDYGGGARWFAKPHLAFSFDVRFYAINPSAASGSLPGSPRTTLLVIGAGVSIK
jgi:hypothetical protein